MMLCNPQNPPHKSNSYRTTSNCCRSECVWRQFRRREKCLQEEFQPLMVNYSAKALNRTFAARADYYPRLGLPFAIFGDPAVETYVLSRGQLQPDYYVSIVAFTRRKLWSESYGTWPGPSICLCRKASPHTLRAIAAPMILQGNINGFLLPRTCLAVPIHSISS